MLSKCKETADKEFAPVYFDCTIKIVITFKYDLDKSFHEIFKRVDNWINEGSAGKLNQ